MQQELVDPAALRRLKLETGASFARILGFFRDDGVRSLDQIDEGMRVHSAAALVLPSHSLKGEALQFGAVLLAGAAERVEMAARDCVEAQGGLPAMRDVDRLRPLFEQTIAVLMAGAGPVAAPPPLPVAAAMPGRPSFGRRATFGTATR